MKFAGDKEYEILWADKEETELVLICISCGMPLIEPTPTITSKLFDEVTDKHNKELCDD